MLASSASSIISADTQTGVRSVSPEKREWVRKESESILAKNMMLREKTKEIMYEKRMKHEKLIQDNREQRLQNWIQKTKNSPFAVNLVAEDERIQEETTIRTSEERDRRNLINTRKDRAKNEIILKALSEFSDLEALRKEKRAILDEEQRLRALLSLEKVTQNNKADRIIAERATRQRKDAKLEYRRKLYRDSLDQIMEEERIALMKKHGLPIHPHGSSPKAASSLASRSSLGSSEDWGL